MPGRERDSVTTVDRESAARVIERYPVRFAVLFGSHARGTQTEFSDIDIAVEFDESVADSDRTRARARLISDLSKELGTDAVDVADFAAIRPSVAVSALEHGSILVGDEKRAASLHERFERQVTKTTHEERMDRFDELLARIADLT